MKFFKLTDGDGYTRKGESNETLWGEGISHTAEGKGGLCTDGVIHAYEHPLIAFFMNPIHANIKNPILWEAEGEIVEREGQLKCGVKTLTTLKRIDLPVITLLQYVEIGILCSLEVCKEPSYVEWAHRWLSGEDRSAKSAKAACYAVADAAYDAGAANAFRAAAYAAEAAYASRAVDAAVFSAAFAATRAAAAAAGADFDLLSVIKKVVEKEEGK